MSTSLTEIIAADLNGDLEWETFDIPGGSTPVSVCHLHTDPTTRALTAVVKFPAGWERAEAGAYEAAEEFHVLAGSVELNGERHGPGTWVRVPAHAERRHTSTPDGALTLARFDGPPRWHPTRSTP